MARRPENTARDEIKVTRVFNGRAVVPDCGAEDAGLFWPIFIRPDHDESIGLLAAVPLLDDLFAARDWMSGIQNTHIIVEFFLYRGPISHSFCDRDALIDKADGDWLLWSVAARLDAQIFKPVTVRSPERDRCIGIADAIAMHRAVKINARNAVAMRLEHAFHYFRIGDICAAFVMDHEIVAFRVIRISQDGQRRMGAGVVSVNLIESQTRPLFEALLQDIFLLPI